MSTNMDVLIEDSTEIDKPIEKLNSTETKEVMEIFQCPLSKMGEQNIIISQS